MLSAVELDDQFILQTYKIDNILPQRLLLSKFHFLEMFSAQVTPQKEFRVCGVFS